MPNVQISLKESIKVFVEADTHRILGFAPEYAKPLVSPDIRYTETVLRHAADVERWVAKYREQQEIDAYESTLRRIESESRFRKSVRSAIEERNKHVSPLNRDLNNALLRLMDARYDQIQRLKSKPVIHGMAEAYDDSVQVQDFALQSPAYRQPQDLRASGSAVRPEEMLEIDSIERDRRN